MLLTLHLRPSIGNEWHFSPCSEEDKTGNEAILWSRDLSFVNKSHLLCAYPEINDRNKALISNETFKFGCHIDSVILIIDSHIV